MKNNKNFYKFLLEWKFSDILNIEKHILFSIKVFIKKSCRLWYNIKKYGLAGLATIKNMVHAMGKLHNQG